MNINLSLFLCFTFLLSSCNSKVVKNPNIILINADDLGAHHLGAYGQEIIKTPHLDRMAKEGILFQNGYSSATTCGPSRVALLLGQHLGHLPGIQRRNGGGCRVYKDQLAFPEVLNSHGYKTAMFGKHHNVRQAPDKTPIGDLPSDCGFDLSIGTFWAMAAHQLYLDGITAPHQNYPSTLWKDEKGVVSPYPISSKRYTHNEYVDLALDYISQDHKKPFFLYLPVQIPHWEIAVPRKGEADYKPEDEGLIEQYLNEDGSSIFKEIAYEGSKLFQRKIEQPAATHAAMISRLDRDVGLILDRLVKKNLRSRTIVIFTSDNGRVGTPGGDHFKIDKFVKGGKGSLYEGGIKVPFLFWGGDISTNKKISEAIVMHDIPATILDLANIEETFPNDGISWKQGLFAKSSESVSAKNRYLYWENYHGHGCQAALIQNRYKVIRTKCEELGYNLDLYDLSKDPTEKKDLSDMDQFSSIIEEAKRIFLLEHVPFQGSNFQFNS